MADTTRRDLLRRGMLGGLALAGAPIALAASGKAAEPEVGPTEDLMREHGVLNRILLIYEESRRRIAKGDYDFKTLSAAAGILKRFIEDYHERLEEEHIFPALEKDGRLKGLVGVLRQQHAAGRKLTAGILSLAAAPKADPKRIDEALDAFIRMYRPHEAREDTVLFPAYRALFSPKQFARMGDLFEDREHQLFGASGFEGVVAQVAGIEKSLEIFDLSKFTP